MNLREAKVMELIKAPTNSQTTEWDSPSRFELIAVDNLSTNEIRYMDEQLKAVFVFSEMIKHKLGYPIFA